MQTSRHAPEDRKHAWIRQKWHQPAEINRIGKTYSDTAGSEGFAVTVTLEMFFPKSLRILFSVFFCSKFFNFQFSLFVDCGNKFVQFIVDIDYEWFVTDHYFVFLARCIQRCFIYPRFNRVKGKLKDWIGKLFIVSEEPFAFFQYNNLITSV